jgi:hypothetical protein
MKFLGGFEANGDIVRFISVTLPTRAPPVIDDKHHQGVKIRDQVLQLKVGNMKRRPANVRSQMRPPCADTMLTIASPSPRPSKSGRETD